MKISEVQAWLEQIKQESGDLEVQLLDYNGWMDFRKFKTSVANDEVVIDLTKWSDKE